jgi:hypothetical protein
MDQAYHLLAAAEEGQVIQDAYRVSGTLHLRRPHRQRKHSEHMLSLSHHTIFYESPYSRQIAHWTWAIKRKQTLLYNLIFTPASRTRISNIDNHSPGQVSLIFFASAYKHFAVARLHIEVRVSVRVCPLSMCDTSGQQTTYSKRNFLSFYGLAGTAMNKADGYHMNPERWVL